MDEGQIKHFQPLMISGGSITQKASGTALKLLGADADILTLGDSSHEGGDIKIYRDGSNNLQLSLDADAASNGLALSVYGGVVAKNYLTVGQAELNTVYNNYVVGTFHSTGNISTNSWLKAGDGLVARSANAASLFCNITVEGTDSTNHAIKLRINANDIIVAQATGDGSGGIVNKAVGLYGVTPTTQAAHIADPTDLAECITAITAINAVQANIGLTASS